MTFFQQTNDGCVRISPIEILLWQHFLVNQTRRLIRDLTQINMLTTLMTEICGWRAFPTARTAKHFRKFVRIATQAKQKVYSFPLKNIKLLVPTSPSFSTRAHFSCFNLQQHSFNLQQLVLKIYSNYFKFAATFILFAARFFNLQQLDFICSNFLIYSMSLVGHRKVATHYVPWYAMVSMGTSSAMVWLVTRAHTTTRLQPRRMFL